MSKEIRWLWTESKGWVERGLISEAQAGSIRGLYPEPKAGLPWSMLIFSGLGAVIAGLGIILLFAYNWKEMHRYAKLGVIFLGLLGLHGGGLSLYLRSERWRQAGEALSLLGTMLFGAGIWLIAQIYHIDEHFPNGFLIWGLGALALSWAMPSIAHGLLAVAVLSIWGCTECWGFDQVIHWAPLLVLGGGGLLAWRLKSVVLLAATLLGYGFSLVANVTVVHDGLILRSLLYTAAAFVAAGWLVRDGTAFPESRRIWGFFGWTAFLVCLYLLTFPAITDDLLDLSPRYGQAPEPMQAAVYTWLPLVITLGLWGWVGFRKYGERQWQADLKMEEWLLPLACALCQAMALAQVPDKWLVAGAFNLVFLAIAAAWMARGCREGIVRPLVLGTVLLLVLTTARFFDLFDSLAMRGLVFLLVGGVLAAEGVLFRKARQRSQKEVAA